MCFNCFMGIFVGFFFYKIFWLDCFKSLAVRFWFAFGLDLVLFGIDAIIKENSKFDFFFLDEWLCLFIKA